MPGSRTQRAALRITRPLSEVIAALFAAALACPVAAQQLSEDELAVLAASVHDEYCAVIYGSDIEAAAEGFSAVADAWSELDGALQASELPQPYLLYWRGVLAQCLDREEMAISDLEGFKQAARFLEAVDEERAYDLRSMVQDAERRVKWLRKGEKRSKGSLAGRGKKPYRSARPHEGRGDSTGDGSKPGDEPSGEPAASAMETTPGGSVDGLPAGELDWTSIDRYQRRANTLLITSWIANGVGAAATVTASILAPLYNDHYVDIAAGVAIGSVVLRGAGVPLATWSHAASRNGYEILGMARPPRVLRNIGWMTYGLALATEVLGVLLGLFEEGGYLLAFGIPSFAFGAASTVLMQLHAHKGRRLLHDAIGEADGRRVRLLDRGPRLVAIAPLLPLVREERSYGMQLLATF